MVKFGVVGKVEVKTFSDDGMQLFGRATRPHNNPTKSITPKPERVTPNKTGLDKSKPFGLGLVVPIIFNQICFFFC